MHRWRQASALCAAAIAVAACGGSTEPGSSRDTTPATITTTVTDTLRATAGSQINTALTVTVENKAGTPIDSAVVTFAVTAGGGTLAASTVRTDANGVATNTWTLGKTAGVQTVTATVGTLAPVTFVAVASAGAAANLAKVAGDSQTVAAGSNVSVPPSVKVTDQAGIPVANVLVTFNVASGGGSVTGGAANTDANGIATVGGWKLGAVAGTNTLTATAQGLTPITFTATGTAGALAQIKFTNTAPTLDIGGTFKLTVQALDAGNNVVSGAPITFSSSNPAVATVDSTGTVTAVGAGTASISATSGTVTSAVPAQISVLGHPSGAIAATVAMNSRIRGVAIAGNTAYAALSSSNSVGAVDLTSGTLVASADLTPSSPIDVAVGGSAPVIAAPSTCTDPTVWFIDPASLARTDSIDLNGVNPFKGVMTSNGSRLFVDLSNFNMLTIDVPSRTVVSTAPVPGTVNAMKMARGDTLIYVGTVLGTVYEIDARTSTVRRQFSPSSTVTDLDVSPDGKTLYTIDGSHTVTMTSLATGGLSGTVDFTGNLLGVAISPDGQQLWVSENGLVVNAPYQDGTFATQFTSSQHPISGATPGRIVFSPLGDIAVVVDDGGLNLIIFK